LKETARPPLHTLLYLNGKRRAQALKGRRRQGSKPMAAIRHEARGNAREPDGTMCRDALLPSMFCPK